MREHDSIRRCFDMTKGNGYKAFLDHVSREKERLLRIRKLLKELIDAGYIRALKAPFVFRFCSRISMTQASVYVSTIGPITTLKIKKESVPLIADFFFQLDAGRYFTKLDWRWGTTKCG